MFYKSYKIRLFPTKEQEIMFYKHIGCCRVVWNHMLNLQIEKLEKEHKYLTEFGMNKILTKFKQEKDYSWLNEVSATSLQIICSDLDEAFKRFFNKKANFPKMKIKKKSKKAFPVRGDHFYLLDDVCNIEKIGKVKYKTNYILPIGRNMAKFINPRISLVHGKWILTVTLECENQTQEKLSGKMGIDLGLKSLAVMSFRDYGLIFEDIVNKVVDNINKSKEFMRLKCKLKHLHRKLSRKYRVNGNYELTKNIEKVIKQIQDIEYHLANKRLEFIHYIVNEFLKLNPEVVTMENLAIRNLLKNKRLSRSIREACWYKFRHIMQYKCERRGIKFQLAGRFFPSTKLCSNCGNKKDMPLKIREYDCEICGLFLDRDLNAAINLREYDPEYWKKKKKKKNKKKGKKSKKKNKA